MDADDFIRRWSEAPISERAHYQTFVAQLCRLIGVAAPDDERTGDLDYCFERPVKFLHEDGGSHPGYIDCYRRGAFVLEAKQSGKRGAGGALDPQPQLALFGGRGRKAAPGPSNALETLMRTPSVRPRTTPRPWTSGRPSSSSSMWAGPSSCGRTSGDRARPMSRFPTAPAIASRWPICAMRRCGIG
ncbi:type IIL restriction-modification enzyme MmeI [Brevundimonas sp. MYb52]|uniref:type IIL restriction-modification enzyme MmeI n=1 Tax=unclassified Brevundimonas TaxID=2622653 RepID=UPI003514C016